MEYNYLFQIHLPHFKIQYRTFSKLSMATLSSIGNGGQCIIDSFPSSSQTIDMPISARLIVFQYQVIFSLFSLCSPRVLSWVVCFFFA